MSQTLLEVGAIVKSAREVWDGPGYIVLQDDVIEDIGRGEYPGSRAGMTVVKRPHRVAIPGLVNTHGHAAMTLLRGAGDDLPLMTWLTERVFPMEAKLTEDAIYWGTLLACWEMIRSGTTCFTDMYMSMHKAAAAVEESGMRAVLSWGMVGLDETSARSGIRNSESFVGAWHRQAGGRITVTLGPHAPYTCPPDYLQQVAELAGRLAVPIQIHLSETRTEVDDCLRLYNRTPIAHAASCGLFEHPVLAAHCVHVTDEDIEIMRANDVHVAHNPQSNLKLASGIAPVPSMTQAGLIVGLGTDGAASNNNLDMFEELRLAATLHKAVAFDASILPAAQAFQMATEDGAKAVFLPAGSGTLEKGAAADVTLLDLRSPHLIPTHSLLSNVVYAAGADDVTDVFVAGRALLSNREPQTIDTERVEYEARRIAQALSQ
ncbi:amidohydrolase [Alicyclobacillus cycloheptanicus]|jgi:5-methylthioadenosine/S-adenosylhomocysteine deaminase|uniref:5-methylthioadenosine/S-adenosylhomocysteine deaminase n=1 Tax=Alicyclobacillus cycloheptanicus TaxID=1457 RepID=A0ABT9XE49_9BACL|nr:amidohydrolase [Alicyclobacillus cycloheptanicus]MDQ0188577.1 5-methylthioadenosine/S-adenosylhomocysteine deaminase [Alicyclobacillus cycloheptanicus]WDM01258.1 amidohydrolase [Alicyclobacillus cycloheptanicus]